MMKQNTRVLDTTVLIFDPDIIYKLGDVDIVIPLAVIRELDGLKNSDQIAVAQAARKVARTLDRLGSYGNLISGVKLPTMATLRIYTSYEVIQGLISDDDNKIIGAALKLKKEGGANVVLMTLDINMRTVARAYGIMVDEMPISVGSVRVILMRGKRQENL